MPIHHRELERTGELAPSYNRQMRGVPFCYPQTAETFARGVHDDLAELFGFRRLEVFESEMLIVVEEDTEVVGFADIGVHPYEESGESKKVGVIRFLAYDPGVRRVGDSLLEAAEVQLANLGMTRIAAFPKGFMYHFCSPEGGMSGLAGNIVGLFGSKDYEVSGRTVNMVRDDLEMDEPDCPDPAAEISVDRGERRSKRPTVMVNAHLSRNGEELSVGECLAYPSEYVQSSADAQDEIYINWMGISREFQGQGWGRYLLWKTLKEAEALGYRQCVLGTSETNSRALLFYSNYGFRVTHASFSYAKDLDGGD